MYSARGGDAKTLRYKTKPYPHQVGALKKLLRNRGGGLQVPMRWLCGKSWVAINFAAAMHELEDVRKVLVITVTSGLGVWEGQIAQHCPVSWATHTYGKFDHSQSSYSEDLTFWIVNFENLYSRDY
jgi:hypothetical protein